MLDKIISLAAVLRALLLSVHGGLLVLHTTPNTITAIRVNFSFLKYCRKKLFHSLLISGQGTMIKRQQGAGLHHHGLSVVRLLRLILTVWVVEL